MPNFGLGGVIALIVLVAAVILMLIGQIPIVIGMLIAGLAVAMLL